MEESKNPFIPHGVEGGDEGDFSASVTAPAIEHDLNKVEVDLRMLEQAKDEWVMRDAMERIKEIVRPLAVTPERKNKIIECRRKHIIRKIAADKIQEISNRKQVDEINRLLDIKFAARRAKNPFIEGGVEGGVEGGDEGDFSSNPFIPHGVEGVGVEGGDEGDFSASVTAPAIEYDLNKVEVDLRKLEQAKDEWVMRDAMERIKEIVRPLAITPERKNKIIECRRKHIIRKIEADKIREISKRKQVDEINRLLEIKFAARRAKAKATPPPPLAVFQRQQVERAAFLFAEAERAWSQCGQTEELSAKALSKFKNHSESDLSAPSVGKSLKRKKEEVERSTKERRS